MEGLRQILEVHAGMPEGAAKRRMGMRIGKSILTMPEQETGGSKLATQFTTTPADNLYNQAADALSSPDLGTMAQSSKGNVADAGGGAPPITAEQVFAQAQALNAQMQALGNSQPVQPKTSVVVPSASPAAPSPAPRPSPKKNMADGEYDDDTRSSWPAWGTYALVGVGGLTAAGVLYWLLKKK
jgi:hypothetical protein